MNKYFLIFGIIAVMLLVGFTGCLGNDDNGNDEELVPTASLKLQTKDELNTRDQNQDLAMLSHRSGDNIIWSDLKFLISKDGDTFFIIEFDTVETNLNVLMTKGLNIADDVLFEVGESIYFAEDGDDWDEANDFYLKIAHTPSSSLIFDESIDLGNDDNGNDEEIAPVAHLQLRTRDELNTTGGQDIAMLMHRSGDSIRWSDIKFQISNDGGTFFIIEFDTVETNVDVIMTKGSNIGNDVLFEVGESIYFEEAGGNWEPADDFYLKIVHKPSFSVIFDGHIDLI